MYNIQVMLISYVNGKGRTSGSAFFMQTFFEVGNGFVSK